MSNVGSNILINNYSPVGNAGEKHWTWTKSEPLFQWIYHKEYRIVLISLFYSFFQKHILRKNIGRNHIESIQFLYAFDYLIHNVKDMGFILYFSQLLQSEVSIVLDQVEIDVTVYQIIDSENVPMFNAFE